MKDRADAVLRPAQAAYLEGLLPPRDPLLGEMEAFAAERGVPISDPEVGRLLGILARAVGARRMLEVGTAIGYGSLCLLRAAPEAELVTLERDPEQAERAVSYLGRGGVVTRVQVLVGEALDLLPTLSPPFDLAYIDADKEGYRRYLDRIVPLLRLGGVVVVDNLLWKGRIAEPRGEDDAATAALRAFNGYLMMYPQLEALVLPLGDGLGVAVKCRPTRLEAGGPF